jgi:hypothetical protein
MKTVAAIVCGFLAIWAEPVHAGDHDLSAWFPLQRGNRWVYDFEWKNANRNTPEVSRWTTTEAITNLVQIPEGVVVIRSVDLQGKSAGSYLSTRDNSPYLLHENCVYVLNESWDRVAENLRPDFVQHLVHGIASPDFCFPLQLGQHWGTMDIPWLVQGFRDGIFLIVSQHFGRGGRMEVGFKRNVGVLSEHYLHNGTYDEYTKTLKSFTLAQ